jgi:hypothetical protein
MPMDASTLFSIFKSTSNINGVYLGNFQRSFPGLLSTAGPMSQLFGTKSLPLPGFHFPFSPPPASQVSSRKATSGNFVVVRCTKFRGRIGEVCKVVCRCILKW